MKIEIESLDDLRRLISVMHPDFLRAAQPALGPPTRADIAHALRSGVATPQVQMEYHERDIEGMDRQLAEGKISEAFGAKQLVAAETDDADGEENDDLPGIDADGAPYNADWHSDPAKLTGKGLWRARRGRDEDAYKAWLLEQTAEAVEAVIRADEAEPVATETHALPQDSRDAGADYAGEGGKPQDGVAPVVTQQEVLDAQDEPQAPASAVDLETLIAASLEAAQDASDSHVDLLNACRDFTSKHGHPAFTALKAAVAPDDVGSGKAVQHFTPGERRLMQACIANYPSKGA